MRSILQELVANDKHPNKTIPVQQAEVTEEIFDQKAGTKHGRIRGNGRRKPPLYALNRTEEMTWTGKHTSWEELRATVALGKRGLIANHFQPIQWLQSRTVWSTNPMSLMKDVLNIYPSWQSALTAWLPPVVVWNAMLECFVCAPVKTRKTRIWECATFRSCLFGCSS